MFSSSASSLSSAISNWKQALAILLRTSSSASPSNQIPSPSSTSPTLLIHHETSKKIHSQELSSTSSNPSSSAPSGETNNNYFTASELVCEWMRENKDTNPKSVNNVVRMLSEKIAQTTNGNHDEMNLMTSSSIISPRLRKEILNTLTSPNSAILTSQKEVEEVAATAKNLIPVLTSSSSDTTSNNIKQQHQQRLKLMSAVARTPWDPVPSRSTSSSSLTPTIEIFNALNQSQNQSNLDDSSSSSSSPTVSGLSSALFIRAVAPQILAPQKKKSSANDETYEKLSTLALPNHLLFLEKARECIDSKQNIENNNNENNNNNDDELLLKSLMDDYDTIPEKRVLKTIIPRVLIQRGDWSDALQFMREKTDLLPFKSTTTITTGDAMKNSSSNKSESTVMNMSEQRMLSVMIGLETAMKMKKMKESSFDEKRILDDALSNLSSMSSLSLKIDTAKAVLKLALSKHDENNANSAKQRKMIKEEFLEKVLKQHQLNRSPKQSSSSTSGLLLQHLPQNEIESEEAALSNSLSLSLSNTWKEALQDFSMVISSLMFVDESSSNNNIMYSDSDENNNNNNNNYNHRGLFSVVQDTLCRDKVARQRVMQSAIDSGKTDMLRMMLKIVGDINNNNNNDQKEVVSYFTKKEATKIILHDLGVKKRDLASLKQLRDSWPTEYSSELALKVELRLRAQKLVRTVKNLLLLEFKSPDQEDLTMTKPSQSSLKEKLEAMKQQQQQQKESSSSPCREQQLTAGLKEIDYFLQLTSIVLRNSTENDNNHKISKKQQHVLGNLELSLLSEIHDSILSSSSSSSSLSLIKKQLLQRHQHAFTQAKKWKTKLQNRREVMEIINNNNNKQENKNFSPERFLSVFEKAIDAKFSCNNNKSAEKVFDALFMISTSSNSSSKSTSPLRNNDPFWRKVTFEVARLSQDKSSRDAFIKCLAKVVSSFSTSSSSPSIIISDNLLHQLSLREKKIQSISDQFYRRPEKQREQKNYAVRMLSELRNEQKELSKTIFSVLSVSFPQSKAVSSLLARKKEALNVLVQHEYYSVDEKEDACKKNNLDTKQQELKSRILMQVAKNHTTTSTAINHDDTEKDTVSKTKNPQQSKKARLQIQNYDLVVGRGWVDGADDVAKTATNALTLEIQISDRKQQQQKLTSSSTTDPNQLLWLLQQSTEVRQFVQDETMRIWMGSKSKQFVSQQTITANIWKSLVDVFDGIVQTIVAVEKEEKDENHQQNKEMKNKNNKNSNNKTLKLVSSCVDILKKDAVVGQAVIPFCIEEALMKNLESSSSNINNNNNNKTRNTKQEEAVPSILNEAALHACHVEDDCARLRLMSMFCCSSRRRGERRDDSSSSSGLQEKLERLAVAEGFVLPSIKN